MGKHVFLKHENCTRNNCQICDGGLALCTVCKGAEASLPSDCPGREMTETEQAAVQMGNLDFKDGCWRAEE